MKIVLFILTISFSLSLFGQPRCSKRNGNCSKTPQERYFVKVIKPWKFQYIQSLPGSGDSINKIGKLIFWRSESIIDKGNNKYWNPDISYDVYLQSDWSFIKKLSDSILLVSNCDSINKGGDIQFIGKFILVNTSICVNCASSTQNDYCRSVVKQLLQSIPDKNVSNFDAIIKQFIIKKEKFKG